MSKHEEPTVNLSWMLRPPRGIKRMPWRVTGPNGKVSTWSYRESAAGDMWTCDSVAGVILALLPGEYAYTIISPWGTWSMADFDQARDWIIENC